MQYSFVPVLLCLYVNSGQFIKGVVIALCSEEGIILSLPDFEYLLDLLLADILIQLIVQNTSKLSFFFFAVLKALKPNFTIPKLFIELNLADEFLHESLKLRFSWFFTVSP
jgi:hypothetical protein